MAHLRPLAVCLLALTSAICLAQHAMNNDAVIKLAHAGLGDDLIVQTINSQPGNYSTGPDDLVALKKAGLSDRVLGAIIAKAAAPAQSQVRSTTTESSQPRPMQPASQAFGGPKNVPAGSKIFVAPMDGSLDGFIAAEILKQKLPLVLVTSDTQADFVMTGMNVNVKGEDHWYNATWGGKDKNQGSVRLMGVQSKALVWAGDAGDRSSLFNAYRPGGLSKVAEKIVKQMGKDLALKN
jgi:hypothetical protein